MSDQKVSIKFSADISELNTALDNIVKKAKSISDTMAKTSNPNGPTAKADGDASSKRAQSNTVLAAQAGIYKNIVAYAKETLRIEKELYELRQKDGRQQVQFQTQKTNQTNFQNAQFLPNGRPRNPLVPPSGDGGDSKDDVSGYRGKNRRSPPFGGVKSIIGVLTGLTAAADYFGKRPIDIARMEASATAQTTGRQLSEARTGEYTYESMYGGDRDKAQGQAKTSRDFGTAKDIGIAASSILAVVSGIAMSTTVAGAVAGIPLAGAGLAGLKSSFLDKGMADPEKYNAYRSQQEALDFTTMLAAEHENSPFRKDAIERLKSTGSRDLGMERTLGLNDTSYYGKNGKDGWLQSQMDPGFTDDMVTRSSQGILGAGGSTAMAKQSGIALQAERGLGLTNANQLLGQLSGTQSIPETSKKTLIDIFARGFDDSKYAEQNRKYMQSVTEQVFKGGTTSAEGASSIADLIKASVVGAPTTRNIDAGKSAFEAYSSSTSSLTGYAGGINVSSLMKNKYLSKIKNSAEFEGLANLKTNEIDENDPDLIAEAKKLGIPGGAKELAQILRDNQSSTAKKLIGNSGNPFAERRMATLAGGAGNAQSQKAFVAMAKGDASNKLPDDLAADARAVADARFNNKTTGNAGDTAIQASAKNAQISLETLGASIEKFATDAMKQAVRLGAEAPTGRAAEAKKEAKSEDDNQQMLDMMDRLEKKQGAVY